MKTIQILALTAILSTYTLQAQKSEQLPNTVENQFKNLYKDASNWREYKMITKRQFINFQKSILDSVSSLKTDAATKQKKIEQHLASIKGLQTKITTLNNDLSSSIEKEESISFLGMQLTKGGYNSIMWSLLIGLLAGLVLFVYKFNNSNVVTRETKELLVDVEQEFEAYKKKAIEREQKVRRQLQDEINKHRGA